MDASFPVYREADVVVVGGGPAGMCASVAAARHGLSVIVLEKWPMLGGQSTMCRVNIWHTSDKEREVIFGLTAELVERLRAYGGIEPYDHFPTHHETYKFNPEWMALVWEDLVRECGITVLCDTPVVEAVVADGKIEAAVVATKLGLRLVRGRLFVDASGSADLAYFAGCPTTVGRETDGRTQGMTLVARFDGHDHSRRDEMVAANRRVMERMAELRDQGKLPSFGPHHVPGELATRLQVSLAACTSGDPLDAEDLTRATMEARAKLPEFLRFFREEFPGCENLRLEWAAPALGVRESRRGKGAYTFTGDDVRERRSFPDAVGHGFWMVDIHDPSGSGNTTWFDKRTHGQAGTTYQIPYRILVAEGAENLFLAGRCASATHEGMAGLRIQSHCHVMGQAVGTAAGIALSAGVSPAEVPVSELQRELVKDGVEIDLNRAATAEKQEA